MTHFARYNFLKLSVTSFCLNSERSTGVEFQKYSTPTQKRLLGRFQTNTSEFSEPKTSSDIFKMLQWPGRVWHLLLPYTSFLTLSVLLILPFLFLFSAPPFSFEYFITCQSSQHSLASSLFCSSLPLFFAAFYAPTFPLVIIFYIISLFLQMQNLKQNTCAHIWRLKLPAYVRCMYL